MTHEDPHTTTNARRRVLLQGLALATTALAGCGGGGGDGTAAPAPSAPPPGAPGSPSGRLVYRNSGVAAVYDFSNRSVRQFDPGVEPGLDPGVAVSAGGLVTVARNGNNNGFGFATYGLDGVLRNSYVINRPFAFQLSAVVFNPAGNRMAVALDEETSTTNNTRIAKTLVAEWPSGNVIAVLDFYEEPNWAGPNGELMVRDSRDGSLRLFSATLVDQGRIGSLVVDETVGAYTVSPDGRYVVWEDANLLRAYDRTAGTQWVAAEDATSDLHAPVVSPDGGWVAVHARDLINWDPHVFRFTPGSKVTVDSAVHSLEAGLADTAGRMGWAA